MEAGIRLFEPVEIMSGPMLVIAVLGLAVNVAGFLILRGDDDNLNVQGALAHVLGDLIGSLAAIAAALVIRYTAWTPIDPLLSVFVAVLIAGSGWEIVRRSGHILLEGTPEAINSLEIERQLSALPQVGRVHHIHVWSLKPGLSLATLHLRLHPTADVRAAVEAAKLLLREEFGIDHSTIEVEIAPVPKRPSGQRANT